MADNPAKDFPVTPAMARAGALELRDRKFGERPEEVVTDIFYAMLAASEISAS